MLLSMFSYAFEMLIKMFKKKRDKGQQAIRQPLRSTRRPLVPTWPQGWGRCTTCSTKDPTQTRCSMQGIGALPRRLGDHQG